MVDERYQYQLLNRINNNMANKSVNVKILGYILVNKSTKDVEFFYPDELKTELEQGNIEVDGVTLGKDGSLRLSNDKYRLFENTRLEEIYGKQTSLFCHQDAFRCQVLFNEIFELYKRRTRIGDYAYETCDLNFSDMFYIKSREEAFYSFPAIEFKRGNRKVAILRLSYDIDNNKVLVMLQKGDMPSRYRYYRGSYIGLLELYPYLKNNNLWGFSKWRRK